MDELDAGAPPVCDGNGNGRVGMITDRDTRHQGHVAAARRRISDPPMPDRSSD